MPNWRNTNYVKPMYVPMLYDYMDGVRDEGDINPATDGVGAMKFYFQEMQKHHGECLFWNGTGKPENVFMAREILYGWINNMRDVKELKTYVKRREDMTPHNTFYRVYAPKTTKRVEILCIGKECVDHERLTVYDDINKLPVEIQDKMASLSLLEEGEEIEGLGTRHNEETYYIEE